MNSRIENITKHIYTMFLQRAEHMQLVGSKAESALRSAEPRDLAGKQRTLSINRAAAKRFVDLLTRALRTHFSPLRHGGVCSAGSITDPRHKTHRPLIFMRGTNSLQKGFICSKK